MEKLPDIIGLKFSTDKSKILYEQTFLKSEGFSDD